MGGREGALKKVAPTQRFFSSCALLLMIIQKIRMFLTRNEFMYPKFKISIFIILLCSNVFSVLILKNLNILFSVLLFNVFQRIF